MNSETLKSAYERAAEVADSEANDWEKGSTEHRVATMIAGRIRVLADNAGKAQ